MFQNFLSVEYLSLYSNITGITQPKGHNIMTSITIKQLISISQQINISVYELEFVFKSNGITIDVNQSVGFRRLRDKRKHYLY